MYEKLCVIEKQYYNTYYEDINPIFPEDKNFELRKNEYIIIFIDPKNNDIMGYCVFMRTSDIDVIMGEMDLEEDDELYEMIMEFDTSSYRSQELTYICDLCIDKNYRYYSKKIFEFLCEKYYNNYIFATCNKLSYTAIKKYMKNYITNPEYWLEDPDPYLEEEWEIDIMFKNVVLNNK
jgi:hypothetical protein